METRLAAWINTTPQGLEADEILRACVHCGFCLATCPTYQVLGDELDSPRGRIYQIKQVLEGIPATRDTQVHLDRCLTCRSCETTCPSGVEYGHLVDIGREVVARQVRRPWAERAYRWLLRASVPRPLLFGTAIRVARSVSWMLPQALRAKVGNARASGPLPSRTHTRKVLLLNSCAQRALAPSIDAATARVLDAIGIQALYAPKSGCCGAIHQHLDDPAGAREFFRRNIDAWWPFIESGCVSAIIVNASGCGSMVREYAHHLRDDSTYALKARRVVAMTLDPAEFLSSEWPTIQGQLKGPPPASRVAFHPPCTLQHGLKIRGTVEKMLQAAGAHLVPVDEAHLCCGSAGAYSLLQPQMAQTLRSRKLEKLLKHAPQEVLSANIGCITHLQGATGIPVRHWIEWLDEALTPHGVR